MAGPTDKEPGLPLGLWSRGECVELSAEAAELYAQSRKAIVAAKKAKEKAPKSIKPLEIGKTHVAIMQLERRALRMRQWGEPAGWDFSGRGGKLRYEIGNLIESLRTPLRNALSKGSQLLTTKAKGKLKVLAQINKLIKNGDLVEAESKLLPIFDELDAIAIWYTIGDSRPEAMKPYDAAMMEMTPRLHQQAPRLPRRASPPCDRSMSRTLAHCPKRSPRQPLLSAKPARRKSTAKRSTARKPQRTSPTIGVRSTWRPCIARRSIGPARNRPRRRTTPNCSRILPSFKQRSVRHWRR